MTESQPTTTSAPTAAKLQSVITDEIQNLWKESNAPARHSRLDMNTVTVHPLWRHAFQRMKSKLGWGMLTALVGVGDTKKTQLGVELMKRAVSMGKTVYYNTMLGFYLDVKEAYSNGESEKSVIERYRKPWFLVLDELGKIRSADGETSAKWEQPLLFELLNHRYADMTDTLIISNQKREALETMLGASLVRRINETGGITDANWL